MIELHILYSSDECQHLEPLCSPQAVQFLTQCCICSIVYCIFRQLTAPLPDSVRTPLNMTSYFFKIIHCAFLWMKLSLKPCSACILLFILNTSVIIEWINESHFITSQPSKYIWEISQPTRTGIATYFISLVSFVQSFMTNSTEKTKMLRTVHPPGRTYVHGTAPSIRASVLITGPRPQRSPWHYHRENKPSCLMENPK